MAGAEVIDRPSGFPGFNLHSMNTSSTTSPTSILVDLDPKTTVDFMISPNIDPWVYNVSSIYLIIIAIFGITTNISVLVAYITTKSVRKIPRFFRPFRLASKEDIKVGYLLGKGTNIRTNSHMEMTANPQNILRAHSEHFNYA